MTNKRSTKRALVLSLLSMLLCVTMLVGTTFAWFTDSVTSSGNIIKSGTLDVSLWYSNTYENDKTDWQDASQGPIFNYEYWEPGFTEVKYVKIANDGTLAFRWKLSIIPNQQVPAGEVNLADVIDVYMIPVTVEPTREILKADTYKVGNLTSLIEDGDGAAYGIMLPAAGKGSDDVTLDPADANITTEGSVEYCIVLKMQESAGNEYQDLSVGEGFSVQLLAMQYTYENDSFDNQYDNDAGYLALPVAKVVNTGAMEDVVMTAGMNNKGSAYTADIVTSYSFKTTESFEDAQKSPYAKWHADFVVTTNKDVAPNKIALAGYYEAYCKDFNDNMWVALESDELIEAGTEIRLLDVLFGNTDELRKGSINYEELCNWIPEFNCGIVDKGAEAGTTITVELRLYEVVDKSDSQNNSWNEETGKYETIGTYSYTFN